MMDGKHNAVGDAPIGEHDANPDAERRGDRLRSALRDCEAIRQEEQRHFRNVLAVIRAMVRRTADDADSVEDYCGRLDGRLAAYIQIQALVARDGAVDLETMLADELLRFGLRLGEHSHLVGRPVAIGGHAAGLLALAFHDLAADLVTNGDLDGPDQQLRVSWSCMPDGSVAIEWMTGERATAHQAGERRLPGWLLQALEQQLSVETEERIVGDAAVLTIRLPDGPARGARSRPSQRIDAGPSAMSA